MKVISKYFLDKKPIPKTKLKPIHEFIDSETIVSESIKVHQKYYESKKN